jgi:hypothetical protein
MEETAYVTKRGDEEDHAGEEKATDFDLLSSEHDGEEISIVDEANTHNLATKYKNASHDEANLMDIEDVDDFDDESSDSNRNRRRPPSNGKILTKLMKALTEGKLSDAVAWVKAVNSDGEKVEAVAFNRTNFNALASKYFPSKRNPGDLFLLHYGFERIHIKRMDTLPWVTNSTVPFITCYYHPIFRKGTTNKTLISKIRFATKRKGPRFPIQLLNILLNEETNHSSISWSQDGAFKECGFTHSKGTYSHQNFHRDRPEDVRQFSPSPTV